MPETPAPERAAAPPRAGRLLADRYRLTHLIARGGMAEVWEAHDEILARPVAVKVLHAHLAADRSFMLRFRAEAIAAARLAHPSIVAIYDTCNDDGLEAIVMELVNGRTLRQYLDERGRLDPVEVTQIGADVADALGAAHRAGLVHRDVKPANILLSDDGRVLVTDFGIAKVRDDSEMTTTGTMLGTVKYLAPEQVEGGRVDGRTDVYGLGVVLYEAVCGRPPFVADGAAATALIRLHQDPPPPHRLRADIPPELEAVLLRALARDPDKRFASSADLRAALLAPRVTQPPSAPPAMPSPTAETDRTIATDAPTAAAAGAPTASATSDRPRHRRPRFASALVLLVVLGAGIVSALLLGRTNAGRDVLDKVDQAPLDVATPVEITGVQTFDPGGTGTPGENDAEVALAIDGDPRTGWRTEGYLSRTFGIKPGVGLYVALDRSAALRRLDVTSPTRDWSAQVYVADRPGTTLADWGRPVAQITKATGNATAALDGAKGRYVLLWITDLGNGPSLVTAQINELTVES